MINPVELLRVFGKRKEFAQRHSDFYGFVFRILCEELETGSEIGVWVNTPGKKKEVSACVVSKEDGQLLKELIEAIK